MTTAIDIKDRVLAAMRAADAKDPRAAQSRAGILGPSDIGFCRQKAVLVTRGVEPSDEKKTWAAQVGTSIHRYIMPILHESNPSWLVDAIHNITVTATLPSGATISGHPDIIAQDINAILDVKTVDGFEWVMREGTSESHDFQRHLYALGAIQGGLLDPDATVYVGNIYFDRSGKEQEPLVLLSEYNPEVIERADAWIGDVQYAVLNNEDASRDIAAFTCAKICEFYTICRGNLPVHEGQVFIEDDETKTAIRLYVEGQSLEKQGAQLKKEARSALVGVNGTDGVFQVRWTEIPESKIEGYVRRASVRLDVVPLGGSGV